MHLHASSLQFRPTVFEAGVAAREAAEAEQAAEARRRLAKAASQIGAPGSDEETLLISHWLDSRHSRAEAPAEYRVTATGREPELG